MRSVDKINCSAHIKMARLQTDFLEVGGLGLACNFNDTYTIFSNIYEIILHSTKLIPREPSTFELTLYYAYNVA